MVHCILGVKFLMMIDRGCDVGLFFGLFGDKGRIFKRRAEYNDEKGDNGRNNSLLITTIGAASLVVILFAGGDSISLRLGTKTFESGHSERPLMSISSRPAKHSLSDPVDEQVPASRQPSLL